jgi:hypothetical protein
MIININYILGQDWFRHMNATAKTKMQWYVVVQLCHPDWLMSEK